jgi:hypothetical protein
MKKQIGAIQGQALHSTHGPGIESLLDSTIVCSPHIDARKLYKLCHPRQSTDPLLTFRKPQFANHQRSSQTYNVGSPVPLFCCRLTIVVRLIHRQPRLTKHKQHISKKETCQKPHGILQKSIVTNLHSSLTQPLKAAAA